MSNGNVYLPNKIVSEALGVVVNFTSDLIAGDSIASVGTTLCTVYLGVDASPSSMISGIATFFGDNTVQQKVIGGVVGVTYRITFTVVTALGYVLDLQGFLVVIPGQGAVGGGGGG